jgi:hypothetical protein
MNVLLVAAEKLKHDNTIYIASAHDFILRHHLMADFIHVHYCILFSSAYTYIQIVNIIYI